MARPAVDTAFTCHTCPATITVFGPHTNVHSDASLRRVGWTRDDGVVTCRRCLQKRSRAVLAAEQWAAECEEFGCHDPEANP